MRWAGLENNPLEIQTIRYFQTSLHNRFIQMLTYNACLLDSKTIATMFLEMVAGENRQVYLNVLHNVMRKKPCVILLLNMSLCLSTTQLVP